MTQHGKIHSLLGTNYRFDGQSGEYVNTMHQRIAEEINKYNPELRLTWVPPAIRTKDDIYPYALVHSPIGKPEYVVCNLREDELEYLLERVYRMDTRRSSPLSALESHEKARKVLAEQEWRDDLDTAHEVAAQIWKSPRNRYTYKGKVFE
jgi:hypothetical protein